MALAGGGGWAVGGQDLSLDPGPGRAGAAPGSAEANSFFLHNFFLLFFFQFLPKAVLRCSFLEPLQDHRHRLHSRPQSSFDSSGGS